MINFIVLFICLKTANNLLTECNVDGNESNGKSKSTINKAVETTMETTNDLGITDKHPSGKKINQMIEKLNKPLRKVAHASEYCVLAILIYLCLRCVNIKKIQINNFTNIVIISICLYR